MRKVYLFVMALALTAAGPTGLLAQERGTIQGTVVSALTQRPLAGVQLTVPGTALGSLTNAEGRFQIVNVPAGSRSVRAQMIGYIAAEQAVEVPAGGAATVSLSLQETAVALEGVVVTALGIEREQRTLGVAAQTLQGEQLTRVEPNIVNAFTGKVAGVNITAAGPQGGSSRIVIRGESSITGDNRPLFIVDGIPIDNYSTGGYLNTGQGGFDYGNAVQDLNPDMIESVTVLKGPNAAALYGSRAANGVILITTRKGSGARGAEVVVSQTTSFETPLRLPLYQNRFGQGSEGQFAFWDGFGGGINDGTDESWGPPLDSGLMIPQWNSPIDPGTGERVPLPWTSRPNNVREFFELGQTHNTSVSIATGTDRMSGRFGISRLDQNAMMPGQELAQTSLSFGGMMQATDRLDLNTSAQYVRQDGRNRPGIAYGGDNPMSQMIWGARQLDFNELRRMYNVPRGEDEPANIRGLHHNWNYLYFNNPYFLQFENPNEDERNRLIGQVQLGYRLTDWLRATARTGTDWYREERAKMFAANTVGGLYTTNPLTVAREFVGDNGAFSTWGIDFQETNSDFLFIANPAVTGPFSVGATFGGNRRDWHRRHNYTWVRDLATPGVFDVSNAAETPDLFTHLDRKRVNSLLGQVDLGFNDFLYLTLTGRNDWSSTLPEANRSYFYPSVSTSFVFSDAIPFFQQTPLTYGKLRASWARVGNDTDPYQLRNIFVAGRIFAAMPTFTIPGRLRNANLRPEITESVEFGVELGALNDRIGLDLTYYTAETRDQIMPVELSRTTGYTSQMINAGTVQNRGWEGLVRVTPVLTRDFRWESSFTYARNRNKVVSLAEGVDGLRLSLGNFWGIENWARVGEPLGQLVSVRPLQRSPDGQLVIHPTLGYPLWSNTPAVIGNFNPDWRGGWANDFRYRNARLNALLDIRRGGQVYSVTHSFGRFAGVLDETAIGRCTPVGSPLADNPPPGYPLCSAETGLVLAGVNRVVEGGDTTYVPNQTVIDAQNRWFYGYFAPETHLVDASFVKLRELTLGYDVPRSITSRMRVDGLTLALVGRNLALWTENPHIDPETAFDDSNVQGFEYGQIPSARSVGFTITVRP
jgi:TonB-linked SusC/RagA family outer membrane protein